MLPKTRSLWDQTCWFECLATYKFQLSQNVQFTEITEKVVLCDFGRQDLQVETRVIVSCFIGEWCFQVKVYDCFRRVINFDVLKREWSLISLMVVLSITLGWQCCEGNGIFARGDCKAWWCVALWNTSSTAHLASKTKCCSTTHSCMESKFRLSAFACTVFANAWWPFLCW